MGFTCFYRDNIITKEIRMNNCLDIMQLSPYRD